MRRKRGITPDIAWELVPGAVRRVRGEPRKNAVHQNALALFARRPVLNPWVGSSYTSAGGALRTADVQEAHVPAEDLDETVRHGLGRVPSSDRTPKRDPTCRT
jgi:hypothetical protein